MTLEMARSCKVDVTPVVLQISTPSVFGRLCRGDIYRLVFLDLYRSTMDLLSVFL